jgi:murein DD-endopeptidase MepM/ murein hydrolase activator NlpD
MANGSSDGAGLTRLSFLLDPWASPADPAWSTAYDAAVANVTAGGGLVYGVLEPDLAPTPLADKLSNGDVAEAAAWIDAYVENAADTVARYTDRVAAWEVLPQPETTGATGPQVSAAWLAKVLADLRRAVKADPRSAGAMLVASIPAGPRGGPAYLMALYDAGRSGQDWAGVRSSTGGYPLDAIAVRHVLDVDGLPAAAKDRAVFDALAGAVSALEGAGGTAKPIFVSGFTRSGQAQDLAVDAAVAAVLQAIADDPNVTLAARGAAENWPIGPVETDGARDAVSDPLAPPLVMFAPAEVAATRGAVPGAPPVVDGFGFPVGPTDDTPWHDYYIAAGVADEDYHRIFKGVWHTGEDWNGKVGGDRYLGSPIYAVAHGLVVTARYFPTSWGNIVLVQHSLPDGAVVWSQYAHLRDMMVAEGDIVTRGQQVGTLGKGAANRWPAHLHFELRVTDLPATNWFPMVRDRDKVMSHYAVPKDFIAARRPGQAPTGGPVVIVDTTGGAGGTFEKADVPNWLDVGTGYGGGALYTFAARRTERNVATWTAQLPAAGTYQVSVFVPRRHATTENATYTVTHDGGDTTARVNQRRYDDQWVPLGTFPCTATCRVRLSDLTGEANALKHEIAYDAVRWLKVG